MRVSQEERQSRLNKAVGDIEPYSNLVKFMREGYTTDLLDIERITGLRIYLVEDSLSNCMAKQEKVARIGAEGLRLQKEEMYWRGVLDTLKGNVRL